MAQVNFEDGEFYGELHFIIETEFDGYSEVDITFHNFDNFNYYLKNYYSNNYKEIFKTEDVSDVEFKGITFKGRQDTERFSVDFLEGWKRATIIFSEQKFGDVNIEKLKRMMKIIEE